MNKAKKERRRGMSVLEPVAAVAILAVSICMILNCFYGVASFQKLAHDKTYAHITITSLYDDLRAQGVAAFCNENEIALFADGETTAILERQPQFVRLALQPHSAWLYQCQAQIYGREADAAQQQNEICSFTFLCTR